MGMHSPATPRQSASGVSGRWDVSTAAKHMKVSRATLFRILGAGKLAGGSKQGSPARKKQEPK